MYCSKILTPQIKGHYPHKLKVIIPNKKTIPTSDASYKWGLSTFALLTNWLQIWDSHDLPMFDYLLECLTELKKMLYL